LCILLSLKLYSTHSYGFHCHKTPDRTIALGSTQPLTELSTRCISWRYTGGRCVRLTFLPPFCAVVMKSGNIFSFCRLFTSMHVPLHMQHYMLFYLVLSVSCCVFNSLFLQG